MRNPVAQYFINIAIWLDEGLNLFTGGDPGETVSSRAAKARMANKKWGCILCKILGWITQTDHCQRAYDKYVGSRAVIPDGE